jgi:signal transduction histidine kinase
VAWGEATTHAGSVADTSVRRLGTVLDGVGMPRAIRAWARWWPEAAGATFVVVCLAAMVALPRWQPVPFNLIWVCVTILYSHRMWPLRSVGVILAGVAVGTGGAMAIPGEPSHVPTAELLAVPLIGMLFMLVRSDVHDRGEALGRVRLEAEREREFVRDASHELRTPITIARGHAELITYADADSEAAHDVAVVLGELDRLATIAERLLVLASAEHRGFLMREPVPLVDLVQAAAARWTVVADRLWTVRAAPSGTVLVDRARIDVALDALIENAIKATGPGDVIALQAFRRGGVPILSVADRGIGIAPEDRERVFERFGRVSPTHGTVRAGTGLGLPMVRAVAEAHGGAAELVDERGWTTFELRLGRGRE